MPLRGPGTTARLAQFAQQAYQDYTLAAPRPAALQTLVQLIPEQSVQDFLRLANASSISEARDLPTEKLMAANDAVIFASPYGTNGFGVSVDGEYVTEDPKVALSQGRFDTSVKIMVGQNSNEGLVSTPPVTNDAQYLDFIRDIFPTAGEAAISHIANDIYPPVFDGSIGYKDQVGRAALAMGEGTSL